jgi:hypothetical protein
VKGRDREDIRRGCRCRRAERGNLKREEKEEKKKERKKKRDDDVRLFYSLYPSLAMPTLLLGIS